MISLVIARTAFRRVLFGKRSSMGTKAMTGGSDSAVRYSPGLSFFDFVAVYKGRSPTGRGRSPGARCLRSCVPLHTRLLVPPCCLPVAAWVKRCAWSSASTPSGTLARRYGVGRCDMETEKAGRQLQEHPSQLRCD